MGMTMYMFGGIGGERGPSSDFYKLDMKSRKWTNLTNSVTQLGNPSTYNPFEKDSLKITQLPPRSNATSQIYKSSSGTFLLIFGGSEPSPKDPSCHCSTNTLITVNLDGKNLTWEFVPTTVDETPGNNITEPSITAITPRSGAGSFIHDKKLFVFGGYRKFIQVKGKDKNAAGFETVNSFSILDLTNLKWIVCDRPFPLHVGPLGYWPGIYVPPCFGGNKVLVCRSMLECTEPVNLTPSDIFLFNTKTFTFGSLSHQIVGQVPSSLAHYSISPHRGPVSVSTLLLFGRPFDQKAKSEVWSFNMLTDCWRKLELEEEPEQSSVGWEFLEHVPGKGWYLFGSQKRKPAKLATAGTMPQNPKQEPQPDAFRTWNVCARIKIEDE